MTESPEHPQRPGVPDAFTDAARGERLQKVMARAGVASRRDCEAYIADGRVSVNGQPVRDLPAWVDPTQDRIELDGEPVVSPRGQKRRNTRGHTYILLHNPRRVITTTDDPAGRKHVLDLVDAPDHTRLFPVGRLDAESTGLILLTDDGELANRLTHPRYAITKQYLVTVRGKLTNEDRQKLQRGLLLTDRNQKENANKPGAKGTRRAVAEQVRIIRHERDRQQGDRTVLSITLREGQNREVRRMLARLGHKVRHLKRIAIGPLRLKDLPAGASRPLGREELRRLRHAAGLI